MFLFEILDLERAPLWVTALRIEIYLEFLPFLGFVIYLEFGFCHLEFPHMFLLKAQNV